MATISNLFYPSPYHFFSESLSKAAQGLVDWRDCIEKCNAICNDYEMPIIFEEASKLLKHFEINVLNNQLPHDSIDLFKDALEDIVEEKCTKVLLEDYVRILNLPRNRPDAKRNFSQLFAATVEGLARLEERPIDAEAFVARLKTAFLAERKAQIESSLKSYFYRLGLGWIGLCPEKTELFAMLQAEQLPQFVLDEADLLVALCRNPVV